MMPSFAVTKSLSSGAAEEQLKERTRVAKGPNKAEVLHQDVEAFHHSLRVEPKSTPKEVEKPSMLEVSWFSAQKAVPQVNQLTET